MVFSEGTIILLSGIVFLLPGQEVHKQIFMLNPLHVTKAPGSVKGAACLVDMKMAE